MLRKKIRSLKQKTICFINKIIFKANDPTLLIIGAQKSGTSSLHSYLLRHPNIIQGHKKELHFFNDSIYFGTSVDDYKNNFIGSNSKLYLDSTPAYLYHPDTAENIHALYPNIKMVVLLRDPIKRAYSAWNHYRQLFDSGYHISILKNKPKRKGNLLYESLFEGRDVFPTFREAIDIELALVERGGVFEPGLLQRGLYIKQLREYWKFFSKEQIMILGFKDFVSNVKGTLKDIEDFAGISPHSWNNLNEKPENKRSYTDPINDLDKLFLENFFNEANEELFKEIGEVSW